MKMYTKLCAALVLASQIMGVNLAAREKHIRIPLWHQSEIKMFSALSAAGVWSLVQSGGLIFDQYFNADESSLALVIVAAAAIGATTGLLVWWLLDDVSYERAFEELERIVSTVHYRLEKVRVEREEDPLCLTKYDNETLKQLDDSLDGALEQLYASRKDCEYLMHHDDRVPELDKKISDMIRLVENCKREIQDVYAQRRAHEYAEDEHSIQHDNSKDVTKVSANDQPGERGLHPVDDVINPFSS